MRSQFIKLTGLALAATALSISLSLAAPYADGSKVESVAYWTPGAEGVDGYFK